MTRTSAETGHDSDKAKRRVGDYTPDIDIGELLDPIENEDVQLGAIYQEQRTGKKGPYTLTVVTTVEGAIYHTGSPVIAEKLGAVPQTDLPVWATFRQVKSKSNPAQSYWDVF